MIQKFSDLNIQTDILKGLESMGFLEPTEVQKRTIPIILSDKDIIVKSKTGSGKTAAFGVPMFEKLQCTGKKPKALILTPTRELAVQVDTELKRIGQYMNTRCTAVYGQHNIQEEIKLLDKGICVVTGTPGRVKDHIKQGTLVTEDIEYLVIDEADKMLDMGFIDQVVSIIKSLPKKRLTLLFSATMPDEIQKICQRYMNEPEWVEIVSDTQTVDLIEQIYYKVDRHEKRMQLKRILIAEQPESCMIFCNTRATVDRVYDELHRKGFAAQALHGAISQTRRLKTINQFKSSDFSLLIATDVAARGIHVDDLSLVINYDVPLEKDSYVHRIGRTGRAGSGGKAITMATGDDIMSLYEIEEHIGAMIEEKPLPSEEIVRKNKDIKGKLYQKSPKIRTHEPLEKVRVSRPVAKPVAKPLDRPVAKPVDRPIAKPVDRPIAKPIEEAIPKRTPQRVVVIDPANKNGVVVSKKIEDKPIEKKSFLGKFFKAFKR